MLADAIVDRVAARLTMALAPPRTALVPFVVDGCDAGYLDATRAKRLEGFPDVFEVGGGAITLHRSLAASVTRTEALDRVARTLSGEGALTRWRDERYGIVDRSGALLFELERAAARYFGIATHAAHVNGTTMRTGELRMWIARRSPTKPIDPGMLDNLVGGGVASGVSVADTVVKEAREEAGISRALSANAEHCGTVRIFRWQPDGLHRETVHVHDLDLPEDFVPRSEDGEVVDYRLAPIDDVARWIGETDGDDVVTADASLVVVDWLLRHGYVRRDSAAFAALNRMRG